MSEPFCSEEGLGGRKAPPLIHQGSVHADLLAIRRDKALAD